MQRLKSMFLSVVVLGLAAQPAQASCGSAFCMVNTNWSLQGNAVEPGWRMDLRYEYINQNQLMSGRNKVEFGQIPRDHDEVKTINRNTVATVDYVFDGTWGVSATLPMADRSHVHIDNDGGGVPEAWNYSRAGDTRVLGRYQLRSENPAHASLSFYGLNFGLKLPTGDRNLLNADGVRAERTLQPGTGTTDLLLGGYYSRILGHADSSWFVQALWQAPMSSREDFRPGQRVSLDLGYRHEAGNQIGLMIQLNALHKSRDSGLQAEPGDSGGRFLYVSPGISYAITRDFQLYGFLQLPVYQYVNGVQLTARQSVVAGTTIRF